MSIAAAVKEANQLMFSPDSEIDKHPDFLVWEPICVDSYVSPDGRNWVRVYLDGSSLHSDGRVQDHAPSAARIEAAAGEWAVAA